jgi:tripartite-type tricarboxylate transporter receptor subunit TctC
MKKSTFIVFTLVFVIFAMPYLCLADDYPSKSIKTIVGFAPGGASDLGTRILTNYMSKNLGVSMVPEYKVGAGGSIAINNLIRSKPDGYTVLSGIPGSCLVFYPKVLKGIDFDKDSITPIFGYAVIPLFVVVKSDSPWKSISDFVSDAKKKPQHYKHGSWGARSTSHFSMAALGHYTGIKTIHVPFKSSGEALTALLGGHVDIVAVTGFGGGLMKSGKIRPLASATSERIIDDVPTLKELGYEILLPYIHAMWVPNGTPKSIQDKLIQSAYKAFQEDSEQLKKEFSNMEVIGTWVDQKAYRKHLLENEKAFDFIIDLLDIPTYHKK